MEKVKFLGSQKEVSDISNKHFVFVNTLCLVHLDITSESGKYIMAKAVNISLNILYVCMQISNLLFLQPYDKLKAFTNPIK